MDRQEERSTAGSIPAGAVARELRAGARAEEPPSALLRRVASRYALPPQDLRRALGDAFGLPLQAHRLLALWPPIGSGPVTDAQLDEEVGAAIAATRHIWDAGGWPFADSEWAAAASTERVRAGAAPIRSVERHADLALWFFFDVPPAGLDDVWVASLWELHRLDPTVGDVGDLPPGWTAERNGVGQPWRRRPTAREYPAEHAAAPPQVDG